MSETLAITLIMLITIAVVMLAFALVRSTLTGRRRPDDEVGEGPSALILPAALPDRTSLQRFDRGFDQFIADTGLGLSTPQGLGIVTLCAVVGAAIPLLFRNDFVLATLGMLTGILFALVFFMFQRMRYRQRIQEQLPDAVFLMARSLRAGQNLEQSMGTVARYGTQPLAREFKWVVEQTDLGLNVSTALKGMAHRLHINDFNMFVTAVSLYRSLGGNLSSLLERVATSIRDRNQFRGYFRAATSLGRVTGFVIALAPILILIAYTIWQPEFVSRLTDTPTGFRVLMAAMILEVVGIVWLIWLLRVDY